MRLPRVVVIGGAQRSGTTLVQTLLTNSLAGTPLLSEAHILCDLVKAYRNAKENWLKTALYYPSRDALRSYFSEVALRHVQDVSYTYDAPDNLVLKDPNFGKFMEEVAELLPDAKRLFCVRDPRDIAASFIKIGRRETLNGAVSRYTRRDVDFICDKINASYNPLLDNDVPVGLTIVRYEDVVSATGDVLKKISASTGLPLTEKLDGLTWLDASIRHKDAWIGELEGGDPRAESVGNFRHILSPGETRRLEQRCASVMARFGYQPGAPGTYRSAFLEKILWRTWFPRA